jgi:adenylate cyclase
MERGDPRPGLLVGGAISVLVAAAFAARLPERAENLVLDQAFLLRAPIRESDRILLVDIDDQTLRNISPSREYWAQAILALDRLGARRIVFDVEFKTAKARRGEYDEETGAYRLAKAEQALRFAIAKSGKVTLAYHFEAGDPIPPEIRSRWPRLKEVFAKDVGADEDEAARSVGLPVEVVGRQINAVRDEAVVELVAEFLDREPALGFRQLREKMLPGYDPKTQTASLNLLQYGYWLWHSSRALGMKSTPPRMEGPLARRGSVHAVVPPLHPFLEGAEGAGYVNAFHDPDGVMRRPRLHLEWGGRPFGYLGLESALLELAEGDGTVETVVRPGEVEVVVRGRADGAVRRSVRLPLDSEGRLLVNWAGNRRRRRGAAEEYFTHLSLGKVLSSYQAWYEDLDSNVRRTVEQLSEEEREIIHAAEYVALSDRLGRALRGEEEIRPAEAAAAESRVDAIRRDMIREFEGQVKGIEQRLPSITNPRIRQGAEKELARWRQQLAGILDAFREGEALRRIVEGKICLIGAAGTASGDLHATPLHPTTPGVDVLANVANMVLTGQVLRRAPVWVDFAYLVAAGFLVAVAVVRWRTVASVASTLGVMAASLAVFWLLFTVPMVLISGAGPLAAAFASFAGTTAFKELVAQRSKRKLQRELEKNTSPELVAILIEHPELLAQPRKTPGTFFFSDVKSFTSISEKMAAEVLVPFINKYLDRMTQALLRHKAYLDKYIGDGIMALFGMPVAYPDHARNACRAALECQELLRVLNAEFALQGLPQLRNRTGIHSGEAIAGYVGASDRANYTVLGDAVNLAARLEGANKEYDTSILISEATHDRVKGGFVVREIDRIRVVGKRNAVRVYELLAAAGGPVPFPDGFLAAYEGALASFRDRRWAEAVEGFERALALGPGDRPCEIYLARANGFREAPPPADWEGIFDLTSK